MAGEADRRIEMDFNEERTPDGLLIKILLDKWQFLAFDKKGRSIYVDSEGRGILHRVPLIIFVGRDFEVRREYEREYHLLKVRDGQIIVPYLDRKDLKTKYFFIPTDKALDLIPVRIKTVPNIAFMVKEIDVTLEPDYVAIDDSVTSNDIIIIKSRYKVDDVIFVELVNNVAVNDQMMLPDDDRPVNLNIMSSNPVFLARIHLRNMALSQLNQLLLDFEIAALDTEYIIKFIEELLEKEDSDESVQKNRQMLIDIRDAFQFYLYLLQRNDDEVKEMIQTIESPQKLAPYRTLVSKVQALHPEKEEQLIYTEYENMIMERREELMERTT